MLHLSVHILFFKFLITAQVAVFALANWHDEFRNGKLDNSYEALGPAYHLLGLYPSLPILVLFQDLILFDPTTLTPEQISNVANSNFVSYPVNCPLLS
jgi:hypothetical protein